MLADEQWAEVRSYNITDLQQTWHLLERLAPELQALAALSGEQEQDLRSVSSAQVVERVFLAAYRRDHDRDPIPTAAWREVRYRPVPGVARPRTWDAADWFDKITNEPIPMVPRGGRSRPDVPAAKFAVGKLRLSVGSGGLHSADAPGVFYATRKRSLLSVDVQSFYPSLIASKGIAPAAYGDSGRETYRSLLARRLTIKNAAGYGRDPAARERLTAQADGLKLVLNSFVGKTGDPFSSLYDPGAFLAVTLSGQLMLIDLIERLAEAGTEVLSANTDGLFLRVARDGRA
jgi:DNA polymerase elongation subunit (family B)